MKNVIHSQNAPAAIGPYSQAIQAGNTVYVSGIPDGEKVEIFATQCNAEANTWSASMGTLANGRNVLTITEKGYGKQTPVEEYRITARGGLGIKNYGLTDKTGKVVGIKVVDGSEDLMVLTEKGILLRTAVDTIKTCGRSTQGVIVMRFKEEDDKVISIALADRAPEEESGESAEE